MALASGVNQSLASLRQSNSDTQAEVTKLNTGLQSNTQAVPKR